jgi:hypothetical protein
VFNYDQLDARPAQRPSVRFRTASPWS